MLNCDQPQKEALKETLKVVVVIALVSHLRGMGSGHEWVKLVVGSLPCFERFFYGFSGFPLSFKNYHFEIPNRSDTGPPWKPLRESGASWVNIANYCYLLFLRTRMAGNSLKNPAYVQFGTQNSQTKRDHFPEKRSSVLKANERGRENILP